MSVNLDVARLLVDFKVWRETLGQIEKHPEILFIESGKQASHRTESALSQFIQDRRFRRGLFNKDHERFSTEFRGLTEKENLLNMTERMVDRESVLSQRKVSIMAVTEELILNCAISAPRVAEAEGLKGSKDGKCQITIEQSPDDLWVHACDPFGVFHRANFAASFRAPDRSATTHGHSGRGLEIIVESVTDFYIKSNPQYGTWAAARIDLRLSNRDHEVEPKRLFLDFV